MFFKTVSAYNTKYKRGDCTHEHDELYETLATHQDTDREALPPYQFAQACSNRPTDEFTKKRDRDHPDYIGPGDAAIQQANVGTETGKSEI